MDIRLNITDSQGTLLGTVDTCSEELRAAGKNMMDALELVTEIVVQAGVN